MPVFWIPEDITMFPHPSLAEPDGLLGVGGDLTPERLILAYRFGIFPWYQDGIPIHWWYTHPRCVLFPSDLKVSKSMRPYFNQQKYRLTYDQCFQEVMDNARQISRKGQENTWITGDMLHAYANLHALGIAHSVEVWNTQNELVGGLYGLSIGKIFFGESMFSKEKNASKFGFISLIKELSKKGFVLIDCQQETEHMKSLGCLYKWRYVFDVFKRK